MASDDLVQRVAEAIAAAEGYENDPCTEHMRRMAVAAIEASRAAVSAGGEAQRPACSALLFDGPFDSEGHRCGKPEADEIHDPLGPPGRHVYDGVAPAAAADGGAPRALANGECSDHPGEPAGECWGCAARAYRSAADGGAPEPAETDDYNGLAYQEREEMRDLIADLIDEENCSFDHHGYCQAHGWLEEGECPHSRAKGLLARPAPDGLSPTLEWVEGLAAGLNAGRRRLLPEGMTAERLGLIALSLRSAGCLNQAADMQMWADQIGDDDA